jgi:hypothetical protein
VLRALETEFRKETPGPAAAEHPARTLRLVNLRVVVLALALAALVSARPAFAGSPAVSVSAKAAPVHAAAVPPLMSAAQPPGLPAPSSMSSWHDGIPSSGGSFNCITHAPEVLGTSYTGWYGDAATPYQVNTPYYVRVWWGVTGNPCIGGVRAAPEIFLPSGTTLAITSASRVQCFAATIGVWAWAPETAACPQAPQLGVRGGLGFYPTGQSFVTWPTATGKAWQIWVPVISTTKLSGVITAQPPQLCPSCLVGAVWLIDGNSSPWTTPVVGIPIDGPTTPTITYPSPSVTNVTTTSATGTATLDRAATTGLAYVQLSQTPPAGSNCVQSGNAVTIGTSQNVYTLTTQFTALSPGTTYYWRVCYLANGITYWGTNQTIVTQGTPAPRIVALSPELGLGLDGYQSKVVVSGSGLAGATDVKLGPGSVAFTPDAGDPDHSLSFMVPVTASSGFVTVTTPGGTASSSKEFFVGVDTYIDSATVSDLDLDGQADDVRVEFHSSEPLPFAQFDCELDPDPGDPAVGQSCDAGVWFKYNLSPGAHTLRVTSFLSPVHDATPAIATFTVSNGDTTPPDTTITSGPADMTWVSSTMVTFEFVSSETGSTFECRTQSSQIWTSCSSPWTYAGLSQGWHYFWVRARDAANNADPTPEVRSYDVDTIPPETLIWTGPAQNSYVASTSATFTYLGINGFRFECKLDAASFTQPCPSTYTGLSQGSHTFSVRAKDNAGNVDPTPPTRTWTVDTINPVPQPPSASSPVGGQAPVTGTLVPVRLRWPAATDAGGIQTYALQQSLNAGAYSVVATVPASTLTTFLSLAPGSVYRFRVRAIDKAGNAAASASCTPFSVAAYQENAPEISYVPAWTSTTDASAWGGAKRLSSAAGASASLSVPAGAKALAWVGTLGPNRGQALVYVDGVQAATVNLASSAVTPRSVLFSRTGLSPLVPHTLKVQRTPTSPAGATIDVDGFFAIR